MARLELRLIAYALVLVLAFAGYKHYTHLVARAEKADQLEAQSAAATATIADISADNIERVRVDIGVADTRTKYQEEVRNDSSLADRNDTVFPDRLRKLARERRLGRDAVGNAAEPSGTNTTQRKNVLR